MSDQRYLAAILFSDIHQFTVKMGRNEDLMMRLLHQHYCLFRKTVEKYSGRIVKSTGEAFDHLYGGSDALRCALEVQRELGIMIWTRTNPSNFWCASASISAKSSSAARRLWANVNVAAASNQSDAGRNCHLPRPVQHHQSFHSIPLRIHGHAGTQACRRTAGDF
jgi:hypothetical protein